MIAAAILAAGGSSRLGRPKQLVERSGRPLVRHVAASALEGGCDPVIVVLEAPQPARLILVCDGAEVATAQASRAVLAPPAAAEKCRAEAWLDGQPWIFTSYVEAG